MLKDGTEKKTKKERRKSEGVATLPVAESLVDRDHDGDTIMEAQSVEIVVKVCLMSPFTLALLTQYILSS